LNYYDMSKRKHFCISSKGFYNKREEDSDMHTVRLGIENTGCPMLIRIILRDVRLALLSE